ncbi:MAG: hypothetical protein FD180_1481 [Planctomycetota bacterium]|nr:MAG: hypothetical protein FD180_1481 [Planctomycetota bacterium]
MNGGDTLSAALDKLTQELGACPKPARRRGAVRPIASEGALTMRIVEHDGVLQVDDSPQFVPTGPRRRGAQGISSPGILVWERVLAKLDHSQVTDWLESLDRKLTPNQGLRRWQDGNLESTKDHRPSDEGRILLLVHGTFSNTENILAGIAKNPEGRSFLDWMNTRYDQVITFDHPTLSVSPMLNARALALHFRESKAAVDVVCHSRGGLVARWWLEAFDRGPANRRRAVFVGSPLAGTGLASPPNIKHSLSLLSNIANVLGAASAGLPFLTVLTGVFRIISSVTKIASKTPAIDAAIALLPGMAAQSRVGNASELLSLRSAAVEWRSRYFAVRSNFESEKPGWKFWRYFRRPGGRLKDLAASFVFDGENDLVVDSESMIELADTARLGDDQIFDFKSTDRVHHTNYFEQPETLSFIRKMLR